MISGPSLKAITPSSSAEELSISDTGVIVYRCQTRAQATDDGSMHIVGRLSEGDSMLSNTTQGNERQRSNGNLSSQIVELKQLEMDEGTVTCLICRSNSQDSCCSSSHTGGNNHIGNITTQDPTNKALYTIVDTVMVAEHNTAPEGHFPRGVIYVSGGPLPRSNRHSVEGIEGRAR